ncbi:MAG: hypothetical protein MUO77_01685 [Anaerolineales bacterium]|nr:hypothetical protein [Anaerolineales bacterium]
MAIEYDEKGKFYTEVIRKAETPAVIQTTTHLIRGLVHIKPGERLKDELDKGDPFLAVTDATIYDADDNIIYRAPFLGVQRGQIVWIMPVEESTQQNGAE